MEHKLKKNQTKRLFNLSPDGLAVVTNWRIVLSAPEQLEGLGRL